MQYINKVHLGLLPFILSACSACNIPDGQYISSSASETSTALFLEDKHYRLVTEAWVPGDYENRQTREQKGTWECKKNILLVAAFNGVTEGTYRAIGSNPLGLPPTIKALIFDVSDNEALSQAVLYPQ